MRSIKTGLPETTFGSLLNDRLEYGITPTAYTPGTPATREDPGDGHEVDLPSFVCIYLDGIEVGHTTFDNFALTLASEGFGLPNKYGRAIYPRRPPVLLRVAEDAIYEAVLEHTAEYLDLPLWYDGMSDD